MSAQLPVDVRRRDAEREQPVGFEFDPDFAIDAADALDAPDAARRPAAAGDDIVDEPRQLLGRHRRSGRRVGDDRQAVDVEALDDRLVDGARQVRADLGDRVLTSLTARSELISSRNSIVVVETPSESSR